MKLLLTNPLALERVPPLDDAAEQMRQDILSDIRRMRDTLLKSCDSYADGDNAPEGGGDDDVVIIESDEAS